MTENKLIFNNTAYYVKKEDEFVKKMNDEFLNQEKKILTNYKNLNNTNNLTDVLKIDELNKNKRFLKYKKESYEKKLIILKKLVEYINYLNHGDKEIENIKLIIKSIESKLNDYKDI